MKTNSKFLSIVIPVRNEAENLPYLFGEIKKALSGYLYEVIVVDDGSGDDSGGVAGIELEKKKIKGKVIYLKSGYGKGPALKAGFREARGEIIVLMDADLQDDPKDIGKFIGKIEEGFDMVVGWRRKREDRPITVLSSFVFNFFVRLFTDIDLHDINCGLKVFVKEIGEKVEIYRGMYRFLPVFAFWKGYKVTEIEVNHRKRKFGKSKYNVWKAIDGVFDLFLVTFLIRFSFNPIRIYGTIGTGMFSVGFVMAVYLTYLRILGETIGNRPLLIFAVIFLIGGIQLISMGFLGEMIRMGREKEKPFIVEKIEKTS